MALASILEPLPACWVMSFSLSPTLFRKEQLALGSATGDEEGAIFKDRWTPTRDVARLAARTSSWDRRPPTPMGCCFNIARENET